MPRNLVNIKSSFGRECSDSAPLHRILAALQTAAEMLAKFPEPSDALQLAGLPTPALTELWDADGIAGHHPSLGIEPTITEYVLGRAPLPAGFTG